MNSPFIGQQVGDCESFTLTHYLAALFAMHLGPRSIPLCIHNHIQESTFPFLRYSNFNILPWKSKVKVMGEVKVWSHNVTLTSYRFTSLSFHVNGPSHSWDIQHFQNFTLKIQSQRHSWRPHSRYNTLLTHITFLQCWRVLAFLYIAIKKFDLENPKVKVMVEVNVESHNMGPTFYWLCISLSFHVNRPSHSWDTF